MTLLTPIRRLARAIRVRLSPAPRPLALPLLFATFQQVLASNNRALEGITDMGEKLNGNYIFDINYIKSAFAALTADFAHSITQFDTLSGKRYAIAETFATIQALIEEMIEGQEGRAGAFIIPLAAITWDRAREVGGKNYHLAELKNGLGLPVPDGFAVTGRAFSEFFRHNALSDAVAKVKADNASAEELDALRRRILGGTLPPEMEQRLTAALDQLRRRHGAKALLAVRSSADEEDGYFSFAGQFESVLNVPLRTNDLRQAYCQVVASLFSPGAMAYQRHLGVAAGALRMAVGCHLLVDAVASGVVYTADPARGDRGVVVIHAAWGLGPSVVDGRIDTDVYRLRKGEPPVLIETRIGRKESMTVPAAAGETRQEATPEESRGRACLSPGAAIGLARQAMAIDAYFKGPQDIEWAMQADGTIIFLQARALQVEVAEQAEATDQVASGPRLAEQPLLFANQGVVVQRGAASGKCFFLRNLSELAQFPMGAVLVAANDSPQFIRVMPYAAAIITASGGLASHMASVCREFKIPTLVNCGEAIHLIRHGQEITLVAEGDGGSALYDGRLAGILAQQQRAGMKMEELYEYRRQKYLLRYIAPLNLVNPLEDEFTPEKCRTLHDCLRFIHEKSVQTIIEAASNGAGGLSSLRKLELSVPAGLQVLDLGGGIAPGGSGPVSAEQVLSRPLLAIIAGLTTPGAWHLDSIAMDAGEMMGSMMRSGDLATEGAHMAARNMAVISAEYVNLAMRFGYHFNLVDSYCSERAANNHVYFRFVGGAADMTKRSRRITLIDRVLTEMGFLSKTRGDLIIARLSHIDQEQVLTALATAGRLIAFMRQLDAVLRDDAQIERYAKRFLAGDYTL